jgi:hypothetical protein
VSGISPLRPIVCATLVTLVLALLAGCDGAASVSTPTPSPGTSDAPREVNLIAKDFSFIPATLDLIPGETVILHVLNGGLEVHEAVIGPGPVQDAWEAGEAATVGAPPGPTPVVIVPPDVAGIRVVVKSGERIDLRWTVPLDIPTDVDPPASGRPPDPRAWIVGCHIPGHVAQGMWIPIRWVETAAS